MRLYKDIPMWENSRRSILLRRFLKLVSEYIANIRRLSFLDYEENKIAKQKRSEINLIIEEVHSIVLSSGISPHVYYTPPPAIGGRATDIDLVLNMFNLSRYQIKIEVMTDIIERVIGVYESDKCSSLLRTVNPFYWILLVLDFIVSIPFRLLGKIGFNVVKLEDSFWGKVIKGTIGLITVLAAFLTILDKLGYLEGFKNLVLRRK